MEAKIGDVFEIDPNRERKPNLNFTFGETFITDENGLFRPDPKIDLRSFECLKDGVILENGDVEIIIAKEPQNISVGGYVDDGKKSLPLTNMIIAHGNSGHRFLCVKVDKGTPYIHKITLRSMFKDTTLPEIKAHDLFGGGGFVTFVSDIDPYSPEVGNELNSSYIITKKDGVSGMKMLTIKPYKVSRFWLINQLYKGWIKFKLRFRH